MADGIVILDKPRGWTSHQAVGFVRRYFGTRKVGHAGTLDPLATGVLLLGVNRATRLLGQLLLHDKSYQATIRLGAATDTDDALGEVISRKGAADISVDQVIQILPRFCGDILQVPAAVSAIKVNGRRAYDLVRAGEEVKLKARPVTVSEFVLEGASRCGDFLDLSVRVSCSSGTYIRALARDIGCELGVGGHLVSLRRTRVGAFDIAEADYLSDDPDSARLRLRPLAEVVSRCFETVTVADDIAARVRFGQTVPVALRHGLSALLTTEGEFLGLYRQDGEYARPVSVFCGPEDKK